MPPKPAKQQCGRDNLDSASKDTDANASSMEALAIAITAVQASIDSFWEENRVSAASLNVTLSVYGRKITDIEDGMNEFDKSLSSVETSQASLAKKNDTLKEKVEFITKLFTDALGEDRHRWTEPTEVWPQNQQMTTIGPDNSLSGSITFKLKN